MGLQNTIVELILMVVGVVFTLWVDDFYLPFIIVIDNFSVYLTIFNNERDYINRSLRKGESWSWWEHFSHLRNYVVVAIVRGAVVQGILSYYAGQHADIELNVLLSQTPAVLKEALASYIVLVAFYNFFMNTLGNSVIFTCCLTIRSVFSLQLLRAKGLGATSPDSLLLIKNCLNGGFTTLTLTVINTIFRGDVRSFGPWIITRTVMAGLPFLQLNFVKLGLDLTHRKLLSLIVPLLEQQKFTIPERLQDGTAVLTVVVLYLAFWQGNKIGNSIINAIF